MNKFIQIRGCMGSGKTTIVRNNINRIGGFSVEFVEIWGKKYPYTYNKEKNIIITGRYDLRVCGGLDGIIKNSQLMKEYVIAILKKNAKIIIFEAVMYGVTFKFSNELMNNCKRFGYEYKAYALFPSFDTLLERLYSRNGGKPIKVERILNQYNRGLTSSKKLKESGIDIEFIDTSKIPLNQMEYVIKELKHDQENK